MPRPTSAQLTEVNMSCYVFDNRPLLAALEELRPTMPRANITLPIARAL